MIKHLVCSAKKGHCQCNKKLHSTRAWSTTRISISGEPARSHLAALLRIVPDSSKGSVHIPGRDRITETCVTWHVGSISFETRPDDQLSVGCWFQPCKHWSVCIIPNMMHGPCLKFTQTDTHTWIYVYINVYVYKHVYIHIHTYAVHMCVYQYEYKLYK